MNQLILWGGTGQAVILEEIAQYLHYDIIAIVDNNLEVKSPIDGIKIVYKICGLQSFLTDRDVQNINFAVSIGGDKGKDRYAIGVMLEELGLHPITLVHPDCHVSGSSQIGKGCQILMNSTIAVRTFIDDYVIINSGAIVDHECIIRKGVHIGPGATLAGLVEVGNYSFIGTGAIILPRLKIGKNTIIGAGSVVTKDVPDNVIYKGNPAVFHRHNKE